MFNSQTCNMTKFDSTTRILLSSILTFYSIYSQNYYLLIIGIILFYTAAKKYCFLYHMFKINECLRIKNHYVAYLPKHNPSAVFIFGVQGNIVFQNDTAKIEFRDIHSIKDIDIQNYSKMISDNEKETIIFNHDKRKFQVELIGVSEEKILLTYFTDVTMVFELNDEIEETQREVIYAMGEIGETRSKETGNHVKRVALYSYELAKLYGLSEEESSTLQMASPMHDIGKVAIPDVILNAPRKLTAQEFETMKTHAKLGYTMLKNSNKPILKAAAIVANEHHEKYDGNGYPHAKVGEDIHIYGRITAIADVFDALGSKRVYKEAWDLEKILELFKDEKGKHFDPKLVKLFLNNLNIFLKIRDDYKDN